MKRWRAGEVVGAFGGFACKRVCWGRWKVVSVCSGWQSFANPTICVRFVVLFCLVVSCALCLRTMGDVTGQRRERRGLGPGRQGSKWLGEGGGGGWQLPCLRVWWMVRDALCPAHPATNLQASSHACTAAALRQAAIALTVCSGGLVNDGACAESSIVNTISAETCRMYTTWKCTHVLSRPR